jgi:hypothetical protein
MNSGQRARPLDYATSRPRQGLACTPQLAADAIHSKKPSIGTNAAALMICLTEHRQPVDRLRLGVDRRRLRLVLAPVWDEPPLKQVERTLTGGVLPDDPELLARGAIVARRHVAERITSDPVIPRVESIDDFEPELIGRARLDDASALDVGGELAWWKRAQASCFCPAYAESVRPGPLYQSPFEKRVMTPVNRRFVRTALAILGLMALATATVWIVLFMFVRPARG